MWFNYLKEARLYVKQFDLISQAEYYEVVNELHERALVYMHAMPKIWLDYAKFLSRLSEHTHSRIVVSKEDPELSRLLGVVSDRVSKQLVWLNGESLGSPGVLGDEFT